MTARRQALALLAALLLCGATSRADVIIGNMPGNDLSNSSLGPTSGNTVRAAGFTIGGNPINLTSVSMRLNISTGATPQVTIYSDNSTKPGTLLATLTNPTITTGSIQTFTFTPSAAVVLNANTTYWVVLKTTGNTLSWLRNSPNITPTGTATHVSYLVGSNGTFPPATASTNLNSYQVDGTVLPFVSSDAATSVAANSATLNATINPGGSTTTAKFQYGLTTAYGTDVSITLVANNSTTNEAVSNGITGLVPRRTYNFRATATNGNGTYNGANATFSTPNTAPVASGQSVNTNEETLLNGTVTATDESGDALTYSKVASPTHGTATVNPNGTFSYTPVLNYTGPDSFTFKANDGLADSNTATVSITVDPINDAPVASSQIVGVNEDNILNGTLGASDVDGDGLTFSIVDGASNGTAIVTNAATGAFRYTPNLNYNGPDSFTFKVNDGTVDSNTATVTVGVVSVNDAPVASAQSVSTDEDNVLNGTVSATDVDLQSLTYFKVASPTKGTCTVSTNGNFTYTPNLNANGSDSFTFRASDGFASSNIATVTITINLVNDAPVANAKSVSTNEDTTLNSTVVSTDVDLDGLTYTIVDQAANGTATITNSATGAFSYVPDGDYNGPDSFTFKTNDGTVDSNTATVTVTVNAVNDAPTDIALSNNSVPLNNHPVGSDVGTFSTTDVDTGDTYTYSFTAGLGDDDNGAFTIAGDKLKVGADFDTETKNPYTVRIRSSDGGLSFDKTFEISVSNSIPVASDVTLTGDQGQAFTGQLPAVDTEGDPLVFSLVTGTLPAGLTLNTDGSITGTPTVGFDDTVTFKAYDGSADSNTATATIRIAELPSLEVTTTADVADDFDGETSLREAVALANDNADSSTISFQTGLSGTIALGSTLDITTDVIINGPGAPGIVIDGGSAVRVLHLQSGTLTLTDLTVSNGSSDFVLTSGGGILTDGGTTLTMTGCTLNGNSNYGSGSAGTGGGAIMALGDVTMTNCTLTDNHADSTFVGGGAIATSANLTLKSCTIANNTSVGQVGSGVLSLAGGSVTLDHTVLSNTGVNLAGAGTFVSGGNNLTKDGGSGFLIAIGDRINRNPKLDTAGLQDNGGPTQTLAPLPGSPLINTGSETFVGSSTDQRGSGFPRVRGAAVDIGAFETPAPVLNIVSPAINETLTSSPATSTGTAMETGGTVTDVRMTSLRRTQSGGFSSGYWDGNLATPSYGATNNPAALPVATTADGFATWSLALPPLSGQFKMTVTATDSDGYTTSQTVDFIVNDGLTLVSIAAPVSRGFYKSGTNPGSLSSAIGTSSDADGIADVTVSLYRTTTGGNTAGYWDGNLGTPSFATPYLAATHEFPADSGDNFVNWNLNLPSLVQGVYILRAIAKDNVGNYKSSSARFTVDDSTVSLTISSPVHNSVSPTAPAAATGTGADLASLRCTTLLRYTDGVNTPGYWDGNLASPAFNPTNNSLALPVATSTDGFATWSLALPTLTPGKYLLQMQGKSTFLTSVVRSVAFTVNDASPLVSITAPTQGSSFNAGTGGGNLTEVSGTSSDADGIAGVTIQLFRSSKSGNTPGYWNGDVDTPVFTSSYNPAVNEIPAVTADGFATWAVSLPELIVGSYTLRATAKDTLGNYSSSKTGVNAKTLSALSAAPAEGSVGFTIVAAPTKLDGITASSSSSSVSLDFTGSVPLTFTVKVNGASVSAQAIRTGQSVTLLLPNNSLNAGDIVAVTWSGGGATVTAE